MPFYPVYQVVRDHIERNFKVVVIWNNNVRLILIRFNKLKIRRGNMMLVPVQYIFQWIVALHLVTQYPAFQLEHIVYLDEYGNVYVTGISLGPYAWPGSFDYSTIKYDSNGIQLWEQVYHGQTDELYAIAEAIVVDHHGNVYVTGVSDYGLPSPAPPLGAGLRPNGVHHNWQISGGLLYWFGDP